MTSENNEPQAVVSWQAGNKVSGAVWLSDGDFTTLVAPPALAGQSVSVVTALDDDLKAELIEPDEYDGVPMLSAPKPLMAGTNAFTDDEQRALCAAGRVRLVLSSPPLVDCEAYLQASDQG